MTGKIKQHYDNNNYAHIRQDKYATVVRRIPNGNRSTKQLNKTAVVFEICIVRVVMTSWPYYDEYVRPEIPRSYRLSMNDRMPLSGTAPMKIDSSKPRNVRKTTNKNLIQSATALSIIINMSFALYLLYYI